MRRRRSSPAWSRGLSMTNDTSFPLGYYIELTTDYSNYKGRLVACDDKWFVVDKLPGDPRDTLLGRRWWVGAEGVRQICLAPDPPPTPQQAQAAREAEAEPARNPSWTQYGIGTPVEFSRMWTDRLTQADGPAAAFREVEFDYIRPPEPLTDDEPTVYTDAPAVAALNRILRPGNA